MNRVISRLLVFFTHSTIIFLVSCGGGDSNTSSGIANSGMGGSQSRFAIVDNYLYTIAGSQLQLFDLQDPSIPVPWAQVSVAFGIETVFSYQSNLFLGAVDGLYIYDNTDPAFPQFKSFLTHRRGCDPVVVQNNYAYVTIRGNASCGRVDNQLDIIDISDISNPILEKVYTMQQPSGLGIDGNKLFVCDGIAGLKVFDATDPIQLQILETLSNVDCFDVIPRNNELIVSDNLGIFQYDYTNSPMQYLSEIPIIK